MPLLCQKTLTKQLLEQMLKYLECKDGDETDVHLKETDAYYYQIQAQLNICVVPYGDFVL